MREVENGNKVCTTVQLCWGPQIGRFRSPLKFWVIQKVRKDQTIGLLVIFDNSFRQWEGNCYDRVSRRDLGLIGTQEPTWGGG